MAAPELAGQLAEALAAGEPEQQFGVARRGTFPPNAVPCPPGAPASRCPDARSRPGDAVPGRRPVRLPDARPAARRPGAQARPARCPVQCCAAANVPDADARCPDAQERPSKLPGN